MELARGTYFKQRIGIMHGGTHFLWSFIIYLFLKILFIYSWETHREAETQREKQAPRREPDVGLDPGPWDHALSQRQMLNRWATEASLHCIFVQAL